LRLAVAAWLRPPSCARFAAGLRSLTIVYASEASNLAIALRWIGKGWQESCTKPSLEANMLDELDRKILAVLQVDSSLSMQDLAERVGLSSTPCWRRIQKLESSGYIKRRVALLDAEKLNLGVSVFIAVRTNQHNAEWVQRFRKIVVGFPEVVDFYRLSGDVDYLIRAVVSDIRAYDDLYQRLIAKIDLHDVSSMFTMEQIKSTTELPLVNASTRQRRSETRSAPHPVAP
jgi:Lrp/AsnC family transcriptional regulator